MIVLFTIVLFFNLSHTLLTDTSGVLFHLKKCGYLDTGTANGDKFEASDYATDLKIKQAVLKFQKSTGLHLTGILDTETILALKASECQISLDEEESNTLSRDKRYILEGSKWPKRDLTYRILSLPVGHKREDVEKEFRRAFDEWSKYTDLTFTQINDTNVEADIKIDFLLHTHKDYNPFLGPDRDLAHAGEPTDGGIHFDKRVTWLLGNQVDDDKGSNLYWTAVHEIGHVLGLDHSQVFHTAMWHDDDDKYFDLAKDDIDGIRSLYGPHYNRTIHIDELLCETRGIDAALTTRDGKTYALKRDHYWELNLQGGNQSKPELIQHKWPGLLGHINAAFTDNLGKTFFFTGGRYWRFSGDVLDTGYPRKISKGFPGLPNNIDGAFSKPGLINEIYFFKGNQFWKYVRANTPHISEEYPKLISEVWKGVPNDLDDVLRVGNHTYFLKGVSYFELSDGNAAGAREHHWFECQNDNSV